MSIDWGAVWIWLWPVLKQGLIALLIALLALLGYDKSVVSRFQAKRRDDDVP